MTAQEQRAHKRAWTIDRIAYAVLGALSIAHLTRMEGLVAQVGEQDTLLGKLGQWASIVGNHLNLPF